MILSYTDIQNQYLRNIGKAGSTDATILADLKLNLGQRYQMMLAKLGDYMTQIPKQASTVANQQYYHYPSGIVNIETATIDLGTYTAPLEVINSQHNWDILNSIQIQASAVPQFIFPRRDDFGIWPTPQDVYTINFNYHWRDRNMGVADYTTGTVSVTNNSTTITGSGTTFTPAMVGRWFEVTDTSLNGEGYPYRVAAYNSATSLTIETSWEGTTGSSLTYRVAQAPEVPIEGQIALVDGVTADFYAGLRTDINKATWFNNKYWTGDGNNPSRKEGDPNIKGGLIGMMNLYGDRNDTKIVNRKPRLSPLTYKVWGVQLSSS